MTRLGDQVPVGISFPAHTGRLHFADYLHNLVTKRAEMETRLLGENAILCVSRKLSSMRSSGMWISAFIVRMGFSAGRGNGIWCVLCEWLMCILLNGNMCVPLELELVIYGRV